MLNLTNGLASSACFGGMGTMYGTSLLSKKSSDGVASSQETNVQTVASRGIAFCSVLSAPFYSGSSSATASSSGSAATLPFSNPIIQRILKDLTPEEKIELCAAASIFLNEDADEERHVGILRNLRILQGEGHLQSFVDAWKGNSADFPLISSVGDPEVEEVLKKWPITADELVPEEEAQLGAIKGSLLAGNLPLGLVFDGIGAKKSLFLGPTAPEINAGDIIGIYTGFYQLLPEDNLENEHPYVYDCFMCSSEKSGKKSEPKITLERKQLPLATREAKSPTSRTKYRIVISAGSVYNYTKFISNSSAQGCCNVLPNLIRTSDGRLEIVLKAAKPINPGEQLLLWCGKDFLKKWKLANYEAPRQLNQASSVAREAVLNKAITNHVLLSGLFGNNNGKNTSNESKSIQLVVSEGSSGSKKVNQPNVFSNRPTPVDTVLLEDNNLDLYGKGDTPKGVATGSGSNKKARQSKDLRGSGAFSNDSSPSAAGSGFVGKYSVEEEVLDASLPEYVRRRKPCPKLRSLEEGAADLPTYSRFYEPTSQSQGSGSSSVDSAPLEELDSLQDARGQLGRELDQVRHCISRLFNALPTARSNVRTLHAAMAQIPSENRDAVTGLSIHILKSGAASEGGSQVSDLLLSLNEEIEYFKDYGVTDSGIQAEEILRSRLESSAATADR